MPVSVKAFTLCDDARPQPDTAKFDLSGAGLSFFESTVPVESSAELFKHTFWIYLELYDDEPAGEGQIAVMRADSGRRYFFRPMTIEHFDRLRATPLIFRVLDCEFPALGVYFVEFWYNQEWLIDHRLDIV